MSSSVRSSARTARRSRARSRSYSSYDSTTLRGRPCLVISTGWLSRAVERFADPVLEFARAERDSHHEKSPFPPNSENWDIFKVLTLHHGEEKRMSDFWRITQDPAVMGGTLHTRRTRHVGMIVGQIGAGRSVDALLADYPLSRALGRARGFALRRLARQGARGRSTACILMRLLIDMNLSARAGPFLQNPGFEAARSKSTLRSSRATPVS